MANDRGSEYYDDEQVEEPKVNKLAQFFKQFTHNDEDEEQYEDEPVAARQDSRSSQRVAKIPAPQSAAGGSSAPLRRQTLITPLRIERPSTVTVRHRVQSWEDVRRAVDGLREGVQQIINIEQTSPDLSERLIDFMNGATYAIDGSVEKIGAQVYLFTPSTVTIDVEDKGRASSQTRSFFDSETP